MSMTITSAQALQEQLEQKGFRPGCPRHIPPPVQAIDRRVCRRLICPACRRRRCSWKPFTDGRTYRILAACHHCGAGVEM
jgi:hypothetical protein